MKHPFSPLVWLCASCSLALTILASANPGNMYDEYRSELKPGTPNVAAVFLAAQDGVFPWTTEPQAADNSAGSVPRPLMETVSSEELCASIADSNPFEAEALLPEESISEEPIAVPVAERVASTTKKETKENDGFITVDASWFDDALFIGDSHIEGFSDYAKLSNATYYFKRGVDIYSVMDKPFVDGKLTIPQALADKHFGKIYILLGINEIGYGTTERFAKAYGKVVDQLRELQPDALIYIQSIFHTSQKKSESSAFKNETINARNEAISKLADGEHVFYLNCNKVFDDENGALKKEYTGDGVHVMAPYYTMWRDYLYKFGRDTTAAQKAS